MFDGVVKGVVAPYFGIMPSSDEDEQGEGAEEKAEEGEKWTGDWKVGDERWGWGCFGKGEVRGGW